MGDAIKHGFGNLTNFDGQDARPTFWWWVLFVFLITFGISFVSSLVFAASSMGGAITAAASGADEAQVQADMMQAMAGGLTTQAYIGAAVSILGLALIVAAFARRLRDARLPVLIVLVPVLTTLWSAYSGIQLSGEMSELMANADLEAIETMSTSSAGSSLIGYVGYLVVIICGVIPTREG